MSSNKDFKFDKRAASYDDGFEGRLSRRFYNLLLNNIEVNQGEAVLDVGCGTGTILKRLRQRADIYGYGIDVEENMISEARLKCPDMDISVSGCSDMPFDDCRFDVLTACMAYHHFDDRMGFAKEAARVLKDGGCLYITDPNFPFLIRKAMNLAFRVHKISAHFGTPSEIAADFKEFGFELADVGIDRYAQCVKLKKVS